MTHRISHRISHRIFIIAGEVSGDHHAAVFAKALRAIRPDIDMVGFGGSAMQASGVHLYDSVCHRATNGLTGIIRQFPFFFRWYRQVCRLLDKEKPDLLILVDYPGFNMRVARYAKSRQIPVLYYISPQIWAWRSHRIHALKTLVDHMAVVFPFETSFYQEAGIPVTYVGHPLLDQPEFHPKPDASNHPIHAHPRITFMPGSRLSELKYLLPVIRAFIAHCRADPDKKNWTFSLALAPSVSQAYVEDQLKAMKEAVFICPAHQRYDCIRDSDLVIVASGTATLELTLLEKPMIIVYKMGFFTYHIGKRLLKIPYIGLCNILAQKKIVPELIQDQCSVDRLIEQATCLLNDPKARSEMSENLNAVSQALHQAPKTMALAELISQLCPEIPVTQTPILTQLRREYSAPQPDTLNPTQCPSNPFDQFSTWLQDSLDYPCLDPNAMVLSTLNAEGFPESRMVLLKAVEQERLIFYTYACSQKSLSIQHHPQISLLFYWPELSRQVRMLGYAHRLDGAKVAAYFATRPREYQLAAVGSEQSQTLSSRADFLAKLQILKTKLDNKPIECPLSFIGYTVDVKQFEFWQGRDQRLHERLVYKKILENQTEHQWVMSILAP